MKTLIALALLMLVFIGCASLPSQEAHQERQELIEQYEDARMKHDPEKIKSVIKDQLIGKWQFIGIEVEKGNISAKLAKPTQGSVQIPPSSNASEQPPATLEAPNPDADEQPVEANQVRLPPIKVEDSADNQKIAAAKTALVASTRKNLTLEFFEERTSYYYRGSNRGMNVTGQCRVTTSRLGDEPFPLIRFNRRTGQEMREFLFGSEPARREAARIKQEAAERQRKMGVQAARRASAKAASYPITSMMGITVTDDRLYFIWYGTMELTPKGWRRTGGMRCSFKRVE